MIEVLDHLNHTLLPVCPHCGERYQAEIDTQWHAPVHKLTCYHCKKSFRARVEVEVTWSTLDPATPTLAQKVAWMKAVDKHRTELGLWEWVEQGHAEELALDDDVDDDEDEDHDDDVEEES